jgi:hypothetical protein
LVNTGASSYHHEVRGMYPSSLTELGEIPGQRGLRLIGQVLPVHKWCLAVRAYAADGCAGLFSQYTRSGVRPSSARCGLS